MNVHVFVDNINCRYIFEVAGKKKEYKKESNLKEGKEEKIKNKSNERESCLIFYIIHLLANCIIMVTMYLSLNNKLITIATM